jgi:hypothetical protein
VKRTIKRTTVIHYDLTKGYFLMAEESNDKEKAALSVPECDLIDRWRRSLNEIRDKVTDLWNDREIYRTCLETILNNPKLDKTNEFFLFLERMYVSHMLIALRTFDDTDPRSYSLCNLIDEIHDHFEEITCDWFVQPYQKEHNPWGKSDFSNLCGPGEHPCKQQLCAHRKCVKDSCSRIRTIVNTWIAHNAREKPKISLNYEDIDETLDSVYELMQYYYLLLFQTRWDGSSDSGWTDVFDIPWKHQGSR